MTSATPEVLHPERVELEPDRRTARDAGSKKKLYIRYAFIYLLLVPGSIIFVAPFAWLVSGSFQPTGDLFSWPPNWIPENPTTGGYERFAQTGALQWFANSTFVAVTTTTLQILLSSMCAFAFAKLRFPGRDAIFLVFLATMMVPGQMLLIPNYVILQHIPLVGGNDILGQGGSGLLDSYAGLILPGVVSAFSVFLLRQFMLSIPDDLLDAARIDGASEFRVYWSVVLPLCKPVLAATAIFTFMYAWEDFLWPLIIISDPNKYTAPLGLALFVGRNQTDWPLLLAGSVIATLPMVIVFMIFQRQFVQGVAMSGLKG